MYKNNLRRNKGSKDVIPVFKSSKQNKQAAKICIYAEFFVINSANQQSLYQFWKIVVESWGSFTKID